MPYLVHRPNLKRGLVTISSVLGPSHNIRRNFLAPIILQDWYICVQWNLSIADTLGTAKSVLISGVYFSGVVYRYSWDPQQCPD